MKLLEIGSRRSFSRVVQDIHTAKFDSENVHPVYATFQIAADAEWVGRLFVHDMLEELEEGIGTELEVKHLSPALIGETVQFEAVLVHIQKNEILTHFRAFVEEREIASGMTKQKILSKAKLQAIFAALMD